MERMNVTRTTSGGAPESFYVTYAYDDLNQLTSTITYPGTYIEGQTPTPTSSESFAFDDIGNRTDGFQSNSLNEYTQSPTASGSQLQYDAHGNLTQDETYSYEYDAMDRLVTVNSLIPGINTTYTYDAEGRRASKCVSTYDPSSQTYSVKTTDYVYDGWELVAEIDPDTGGRLKSYTWDPNADGGVGGLLSMSTYNSNGTVKATYLPLADGNGNITGLIDKATGTVVVTYSYSAFGQCTSSAWTGTHDSSDPNPFRFSTHYQDENGLIYMGMRYYKADWGRFINRDPSGESGGANLFAYCQNDPINTVDPLGLQMNTSQWPGRPVIRTQSDLDSRIGAFSGLSRDDIATRAAYAGADVDWIALRTDQFQRALEASRTQYAQIGSSVMGPALWAAAVANAYSVYDNLIWEQLNEQVTQAGKSGDVEIANALANMRDSLNGPFLKQQLAAARYSILANSRQLALNEQMQRAESYNAVASVINDILPPQAVVDQWTFVAMMVPPAAFGMEELTATRSVVSIPRVALVDPQLDANLLIRLSQRDPVAVGFANANRAAGLSYNFSARFEFLAGGTRAELRLLEQQYGIQLIRDVPLSQLQQTAAKLRGAFVDGRALGYWDSQVAASAFLKGERMATGDLQFYKRALDLGLKVEYVGTGNSALRATRYVPKRP
jgi:RHS repeat-associated protein